MPILGAYLLPHPPIIIKEVGRGEEKRIQNTIDAYREVALRIKQLSPNTIVVISPHSDTYSDYFHISPGGRAFGSFYRFGAPQVHIEAEYDCEFIEELTEVMERWGVSGGTLGEQDPTLDHGTLIPLHFINEHYRDYKLVRLSISGLSYADHYKLGQCIVNCAQGRDVVMIASGDLSHKLKEKGPYGFSLEGVNFDKEIGEITRTGEFQKLFDFTPGFCQAAGECGLRSLIAMAGVLDGVDVDCEFLSYEDTFGVGYAVAAFTPKGYNAQRRFLDSYIKREREKMKMIRAIEDEYVSLARNSAEHFVKTGKPLEFIEEDLPAELLQERAGVFVSLKKQGELRGCIGTIVPTAQNIAQEIINNAVSACSKDPRFNPVRPDELEDIVYSVDVLSPPEPIESRTQLDVHRYGVIVTCGYRQGLLLPNLEGVNSVDEQVSIALNKGGIRENEVYSMQRFEVVRHT